MSKLLAWPGFLVCANPASDLCRDVTGFVLWCELDIILLWYREAEVSGGKPLHAYHMN